MTQQDLSNTERIKERKSPVWRQNISSNPIVLLVHNGRAHRCRKDTEYALEESLQLGDASSRVVSILVAGKGEVRRWPDPE